MGRGRTNGSAARGPSRGRPLRATSAVGLRIGASVEALSGLGLQLQWEPEVARAPTIRAGSSNRPFCPASGCAAPQALDPNPQTFLRAAHGDSWHPELTAQLGRSSSRAGCGLRAPPRPCAAGIRAAAGGHSHAGAHAPSPLGLTAPRLVGLRARYRGPRPRIASPTCCVCSLYC